ncbi:MAG: flagellar hook-basal body complex protein FliE [Devosia sp.]
MSTTPFNAVAAAYTNASKLITDRAGTSIGASGEAGQGADFGKILSQSLQGLIDTGKASDQMSLDLVNGKANVVDVVTAISQTEIAMESMVAIRDKVISAYEEIMRMPI